MRHFYLLGLTIFLALLSCSVSWTAPSAEPVRIEVPVFEGGEGLDFFFQSARAYEREKPGTIVDLYGDPRIADKIRVRVLEGTYPEVTNAGLNFWALIRNGDILPMDRYLDKPSWDGKTTWRETFLPGSLERYTYKGKVYGIPLLYSVMSFWYNKGMFEQHGWKPPRTWDELFDLCEKIKAAKIHPIAFQGRYHSYAQMLIDSAYYRLVGKDRYYAQKNIEKGSFANPEFEKALDLVQKLSTRYFQPGAMGMSHTESQMEFFLGHAAMIPCGSWLKSEMLGKIPEGFRLGAFNFPIVPGGKGDPTAINTSSGYYFVFRDSKHPQEGIEFLRFMTSPEQAGIFCKQRDITVAVKGVNERFLSEDMQELAAIVKRARMAYGEAPGEGFPDMNQYWSDARFKILTGKITPHQAAQDLEKAAQAVRNLTANPDRVTVRHIWEPALLLGLLVSAIVYYLTTTYKGLRADRLSGKPAYTESRFKMRWFHVILFVGPALLLYTVFVIVPCLKSFYWSLNQWDGLTAMNFKGLLYFKRLLFESDGFWIALKNNLFIMFVILVTVVGTDHPLRLFTNIMFFFPHRQFVFDSFDQETGSLVSSITMM